MQEVVILSSSSSDEGEEGANFKKAKDENFIRIWKLAKEIISFDTSNDKRSTFPYEKFTYLSNQIRKICGEKFLSSKGVFLWNHLLQWVEAMKLSDDDIKDLKYDEKFNFTLIDLMAQFINFKCEYLHRKRRKDKKMERTERDKEINKILNALFIIFDGKFSHIIMTLLKIEIKKDYAFILYPVFKKYLTDKNLHQPHRFMSYVPLILCYKQWKRLVGFAAEKEEINQEALKILPTDVPAIHAGNPFAGISETITYAAKRKKQKDGTRCILLNNKDMDLDGVINKYFKQYEIYINRCETANVHSLKDYDALATEYNHHPSTFEDMRDVVKSELKKRKSYQTLKQSKTRDNSSLRKRCINNRNIRKNLSKNIETIEIDTTDNDSEEDSRFINNSSRIVPFSNQQNNLKNKTLELDKKSVTKTKTNTNGDERDVIIIEEDKNIINVKVKNINNPHLKDKLSRRKLNWSQNIIECISSSDDENDTEKEQTIKKIHRKLVSNNSKLKETANRGLKSVKQGLLIKKPANKLITLSRSVKNRKSSEQNVVLGEVSSTTDHEINLKITKPSQTSSLEVDSSGFTENEQNIREVGSGILNIMPTPYFRNDVFLNSASSDIDDISEYEEDSSIGIRKNQTEKQIQLNNNINMRFLVDDESLEKAKTSKVDSTSIGKTNEDELCKNKNTENNSTISGYSISKPKSMFKNNNFSLNANSIPSTSKQAFSEDTNSSKIISIQKQAKTMTKDIKEVSSTEQNVTDGFKSGDNTLEPCLVSISVYGASIIEKPYKVLFSTNRSKPLPIDHDDDSENYENDYSEQRNCDTPLLDERQILFSDDEYAMDDGNIEGNFNTLHDKVNVSLDTIQNSGQSNKKISKLQQKNLNNTTDKKRELSIEPNADDMKGQSILKGNLSVWNSSNKPMSKENTSTKKVVTTMQDLNADKQSIANHKTIRNPSLPASTSRESPDMECLSYNGKKPFAISSETKNITRNPPRESIKNVSSNKDSLGDKDLSASITKKLSKLSNRSNKAQSPLENKDYGSIQNTNSFNNLSKSESFMTVLGLRKQSTLLNGENTKNDIIQDEAKKMSLDKTNLNPVHENKKQDLNNRVLDDVKSVEHKHTPDPAELSNNTVLVSKGKPKSVSIEECSSLNKVKNKYLNEDTEKIVEQQSHWNARQKENIEKSETTMPAIGASSSSTILGEQTKSPRSGICVKNEVLDESLKCVSNNISGPLIVKSDKLNAMLQDKECVEVASNKVKENSSLAYNLELNIHDKEAGETNLDSENNSDCSKDKLKSIQPEITTKQKDHKDRVKLEENKSKEEDKVPTNNEIQSTENPHSISNSEKKCFPKETNVSDSIAIIKDHEAKNIIIEESINDNSLKTYQENVLTENSDVYSEPLTKQIIYTDSGLRSEKDVNKILDKNEILVKDNGNDKTLLAEMHNESNLEKSQNVSLNNSLSKASDLLPVQKDNTVEPENITESVNASNKLIQKCSYKNCGNVWQLTPEDSFLPKYVQETSLVINHLIVNKGGCLEYSEDSADTTAANCANKTENKRSNKIIEDSGNNLKCKLSQECNMKEHVKKPTGVIEDNSIVSKIRKDTGNMDLENKNQSVVEDDSNKLKEIDKNESLSHGNQKDVEEKGPNVTNSEQEGILDYNSQISKIENIDKIVQSENNSLNTIKSVETLQTSVSVLETPYTEEQGDLIMEASALLNDTIPQIPNKSNKEKILEVEKKHIENKANLILVKGDDIHKSIDIQQNTLDERISSTSINTECIKGENSDIDSHIKTTNEEDKIRSSYLENKTEIIAKNFDGKVFDTNTCLTSEKTSNNVPTMEQKNIDCIEPTEEGVEKIIYDDNEISYIREENVQTIECETINTTHSLENENERKAESMECTTTNIVSGEFSEKNTDSKCSQDSDIDTPAHMQMDSLNIPVNKENPLDENIKKIVEADSYVEVNIVQEKNNSNISDKEKATVILKPVNKPSNPTLEIETTIEKSDTNPPNKESINNNMTDQRMISIVTEGGIISALVRNNRREDSKTPQKKASQDHQNECQRQKLLNSDNVELNYEELNMSPSVSHQSKTVGSSFYVRDKNTLAHKKGDSADSEYNSLSMYKKQPFKLRIKRRLSESTSGFVNLINSDDHLDFKVNIDNHHTPDKRTSVESLINVDSDSQTDYILGRINDVLLVPTINKNCQSEDRLDLKSSENQNSLKKLPSEKSCENLTLVDAAHIEEKKSVIITKPKEVHLQQTSIIKFSTEITKKPEDKCQKFTHIEEKRSLENKYGNDKEKIKQLEGNDILRKSIKGSVDFVKLKTLKHDSIKKSKIANKDEVTPKDSKCITITGPETTEKVTENSAVEASSENCIDINIKHVDGPENVELSKDSNLKLRQEKIEVLTDKKEKPEDLVVLEKENQPEIIEAVEIIMKQSDIEIDQTVEQYIQNPNDTAVSQLLLEISDCTQDKSNIVENVGTDKKFVCLENPIMSKARNEMLENLIPKNKTDENPNARRKKPKNNNFTSNTKSENSEIASILTPCIDNTRRLHQKSYDKEQTIELAMDNSEHIPQTEKKLIENTRTADIELTNTCNLKLNAKKIDTSKLPLKKPEVNLIRNFDIPEIIKSPIENLNDALAENPTEKKTNKESKVENMKHIPKTDKYVKNSNSCSESNETFKLNTENPKIAVDLKTSEECSENSKHSIILKETNCSLENSVQNDENSKLCNQESEPSIIPESIKSNNEHSAQAIVSNETQNTTPGNIKINIKTEIESVESLNETNQKPDEDFLVSNQLHKKDVISIADSEQATNPDSPKRIPETSTLNTKSVLGSTYETDKSETESISKLIHPKIEDNDEYENKSVVELPKDTIQISVSDIKTEQFDSTQIQTDIESSKENFSHLNQVIDNLPSKIIELPKEIENQQQNDKSIENRKGRKEKTKPIIETGIRRGRGRRTKPCIKKRNETGLKVITSDFIKQAFPQLTNYNVTTFNKEKEESVPNSNIENFDNLALLSNFAAEVSPLKVDNCNNTSKQLTNKSIQKPTKRNLKTQLKVQSAYCEPILTENNISSNTTPTTKPKKVVRFAIDTLESKNEISSKRVTSPKMTRSYSSASANEKNKQAVLNIKNSPETSVDISCNERENPVIDFNAEQAPIISTNKLAQKTKLNSSKKSIDEISFELLTKGKLLQTQKQPDRMPSIGPPSIDYDQGMSLPHKKNINVQNTATKTSEGNKKVLSGKFLVMSNKEAQKIISNIDENENAGSFVITPMDLAKARKKGGMNFYLGNNDDKEQSETINRDTVCDNGTQNTSNPDYGNRLESSSTDVCTLSENEIFSKNTITNDYARAFEKTVNILSSIKNKESESSSTNSNNILDVKYKRLGMYRINSNIRRNDKTSDSIEIEPDSAVNVPCVPTIEPLEINICTKDALHTELIVKEESEMENLIIQNSPQVDQLNEDKGKIIPEDDPPKKVSKIEILSNIKIFPESDQCISTTSSQNVPSKNDLIPTTSNLILNENKFPAENIVTDKKSNNILSQHNKLHKTAKKQLNFNKSRQVIKLKGDTNPLTEIYSKSCQLIEKLPVTLKTEIKNNKSNKLTNESIGSVSLGCDKILKTAEEPVINKIKKGLPDKNISTNFSEENKTAELLKKNESVTKETTTVTNPIKNINMFPESIPTPNMFNEFVQHDLPEDLFSDSPIKLTTNSDALKVALKTGNETDVIRDLPIIEKLSKAEPHVDFMKSVENCMEAKANENQRENIDQISLKNFKNCFVKLKRLKPTLPLPLSSATQQQSSTISNDLNDDTPTISSDVNKLMKRGKLKRRSLNSAPDVEEDDSKVDNFIPPKIPKIIAPEQAVSSDFSSTNCWENEISFLNEYVNLLQLKNLFNCPLIKVLGSFQRTRDVNTYFLLNKIFVMFLYECFSCEDFSNINERRRQPLCTMTKKLQESNIDDTSLHDIEQKYTELKKNWPKTRPSKKITLLDAFITKFKTIKKSLFDDAWMNQYSTTVQLMSKNMPIENKFLSKITDNLELKNLHIHEDIKEILPAAKTIKQESYEKVDTSAEVVINDRIKSGAPDLKTDEIEYSPIKEPSNIVNIVDENQITKLEIDSDEKPITTETNENDAIQEEEEDDDFQSKNTKDTNDLCESDTDIVIIETFRSLKDIARIFDPDMDALQNATNEISSQFISKDISLENCDEVFNGYSGKTNNGATDCMISGKSDVRESKAEIPNRVTDISLVYDILEAPLLEIEVETSPAITSTSNNQGDDTLKSSPFYSFDSKYSFDSFLNPLDTSDTTPNKCVSDGFELLTNGANDTINGLELFSPGIVDILNSLSQDNPTTTNNENMNNSLKSSNTNIPAIHDCSKTVQIPKNKEDCSTFTSALQIQQKVQNEECSNDFKYGSKDLTKATSLPYRSDYNKPTNPDSTNKSKVILPPVSKPTTTTTFVMPSNKVSPNKSLSPASKLKCPATRFWNRRSPIKETNTKSTIESLKEYRKPKPANSSLDLRSSSCTTELPKSHIISAKEIFHMPDLEQSKVNPNAKNSDAISTLNNNENYTARAVSKINQGNSFVEETPSSTEAEVKSSSPLIHQINKIELKRHNSQDLFQNNIKTRRIDDPFDKLKNDTNSSVPLPRKIIPVDTIYRNESNKKRLNNGQTSSFINTNRIDSGKEFKIQPLPISKSLAIVPTSIIANPVRRNSYTTQPQQYPQNNLNSHHDLRSSETGKDQDCRLDTRRRPQGTTSRNESLKYDGTPHSNSNNNSNNNINHSNRMKSAVKWDKRDIDANEIIDDLRKKVKTMKSHKKVYLE